MRGKLRIIIAVVLTTLTGIQAKSQNLGVFPVSVYYKLAAGQSEAQVVNISNGSTEKVQFRLYLNDWIRDSIGGHEYFEPATQPRSCARWVTLDKNFVELQPGETTQLTLKLEVPSEGDNLDQMKWAMLFIETIEENTSETNAEAQATVKNLLRVGVHIYQTPPEASDKSIAVLDLIPNKDIPNAYDIVCHNTGNSMIECKAHIELNDANGEKTKLDPMEFPMFPEQKRYVTFELPKNMPNGTYSALGVLDAGEDIPLEAIQADIEIKTVGAEDTE